MSLTASLLFKAPPPAFITASIHMHLMDDRKPLPATGPLINYKVRLRIENEQKVVNAINAGNQTLHEVIECTQMRPSTAKGAIRRLIKEERIDYIVGNFGQFIYTAARHA